MRERITIVEEGGSVAAPPSPEPSRLDLQDVLIVIGVVSGEAAGIAIWWPSALILLCVFAFGFAWLIEREKKRLGNRR